MSGPVGSTVVLQAEVPGGQISPGANPYSHTNPAWDSAPLPSLPSALRIDPPDVTEHPVIGTTGDWGMVIPLASFPMNFSILFQGAPDPYSVDFVINGATVDFVDTPGTVDITAGPSGQIVTSPFPFAQITAIL